MKLVHAIPFIAVLILVKVDVENWCSYKWSFGSVTINSWIFEISSLHGQITILPHFSLKNQRFNDGGSFQWRVSLERGLPNLRHRNRFYQTRRPGAAGALRAEFEKRAIPEQFRESPNLVAIGVGQRLFGFGNYFNHLWFYLFVKMIVVDFKFFIFYFFNFCNYFR